MGNRRSGTHKHRGASSSALLTAADRAVVQHSGDAPKRTLPNRPPHLQSLIQVVDRPHQALTDGQLHCSGPPAGREEEGAK